MIYQEVDEITAKPVATFNARIAKIEKEMDALREANHKAQEQYSVDFRALEKERRELWDKISTTQEDAFKELLKKEYGVKDNASFEKAYRIAYAHGHSSGFNEIEGYFMDLAELIK